MTASLPNETIFFEGKTYFESLLNSLNQAQKSIDCESYIFELDDLGKKIIETLTERANQGIAVRVLVDGAGSPQWGGHLVRNLEKVGGETRIFHPFPWNLWQWSRSHVRLPSVLKAIYLLLKMNSRNHRKVCLIDGKIAYLGSFNISQDHLSRNQQGEAWRDTGVRLESTNLSTLYQAFEAAWNHVPLQERLHRIFTHINPNLTLRLNNTRHRRRVLYKNLLKRITRCKKRVWITNAYFVPDNFLLRKLLDAAYSGIDVRILLPKKSDVLFMPWASNAFYASLLKAGVRIFEYLPSMLHAKTVILDGWMLVGSSNLNHRSLLHDLEVDVNIRQTSAKEALEKQFLLDLENAKEIYLYDWHRRPWHQRIVGRLLLYVKYWI